MKKIWKVCIPIVIAVVVLISACLLGLRGKSFDSGVVLKTERGILWFGEDGAPVELHFASGALQKKADTLATGDAILILHDGIAESFPAQTACFYFIVKSHGAPLPQNAPLGMLNELGWLTDAEFIEISPTGE